jgi:GTPase SAR1 family protein
VARANRPELPMCDRSWMRPTIVVFTGLPGTGKSTLSESLGRRLSHNEYDATLSVIECVCSDEAIHRSRIEGRHRGIPGWHEIDWSHVEHMRSEVGSLQTTRLVDDAVSPLADNESAVWEYITQRDTEARYARA